MKNSLSAFIWLASSLVFLSTVNIAILLVYKKLNKISKTKRKEKIQSTKQEVKNHLPYLKGVLSNSKRRYSILLKEVAELSLGFSIPFEELGAELEAKVIKLITTDLEIEALDSCIARCQFVLRPEVEWDKGVLESFRNFKEKSTLSYMRNNIRNNLRRSSLELLYNGMKE